MKIFFLIFYIFLKLILVQSDAINMTMYYKMPPLYMYEDYDSCLEGNPSELSVYCLSVSQLIPKNNSELWNYIKEYNKDEMRHYRHDIFIYGHCIKKCNQILNKLSIEEKNELYGGLLSNKTINAFFDKNYPGENKNRLKYNKIINQCINYDFKNKYDMMVTSNIRYCVTNQDTKVIDGYDIAFGFIVFVIVGLTSLSTLYDLKLKLKRKLSEQTSHHYKEPLKNDYQSFLVSFSICRNYYRLLKPSTMKYSHDIRFVDAFRAIMVMGVVANHTIHITILSGIQNPEHIESFLHRMDSNIMSNSNGLMMSFFCLSGFVLYLTFEEKISKIRTEDRHYRLYFFKAIILRYIRFTPLLAFVILFNSSILSKLSNGPIWRSSVDVERNTCRKNWWISLLYLQNYIHTEDACLPQLWYIAVDFQIFSLSMLIIVICFKYPKYKKFLLSVTIGIGCLIAGIVTYINDFPGTYLHKPEYSRHFTYFNSDFHKFYIPGHMNINGYIFGIITAVIYLKIKAKKSKIRENKYFQILFYVLIVLEFMLILSGDIFYRYKVSAIFKAFYAAMYKFLYLFFLSIFMIGITQKVGWMAYEFSSLSKFRVLSRLSYSVLVIQYPILLLTYSYIRHPNYINDFDMLILSLGQIVIIYTAAFFTTLCVEFPITALVNQYINKGKVFEDKANHQNEDNVPFHSFINGK